jgi:hypothetical protein
MKILFYDSTQGYLSYIWSKGQYIGGFNSVYAVTSWAQVYDILNSFKDLPDSHISQIQFWCHGYSGKPFINGRSMDMNSFACAVDGITNANSVVWFRACDVFSRMAGHNFAEDWVNTVGTAVVGHTRIVSAPWPLSQSGGYGLRVGQRPYWDAYEGVKADGSSKGSHPFAPHTCSVFRMNVPDSWWK